MNQAYYPAPSYPPPAAYHSTPALDQDDQAIVVEAQQAQLAVDEKNEAARSADGRLGRGAAAFFTGAHTAEKVRTYRVRAADGLAWTYTQPYSATRQMPGEHSFVLAGALPQPVQVLPPSSQWRRMRFLVIVGTLTFLLLFLFGVGLLVPPLFMAIFRPWAKYTSLDPALAKWVAGQPRVKHAVKATRFGWLGLLGAGGWKLPWVIQLYSLGDGTSRLVVKAPDAGRWTILRYRVGFLQAAAIARAFQSILPAGSHFPAQQPLQVPFS